MENPEWLPWVWAAIALLLLIVEIFISGFVLVFFAMGAAAASLVGFVGYGIIWQLGAFIAVTLGSLLLIRPFTARLTRAGGENTVGIDRVIGKPATVLISIEPSEARGRVRIDREEWQATTADGSSIPAGSQVSVLNVVGTRVVVHQVAPPPTPPSVAPPVVPPPDAPAREPAESRAQADPTPFV